MSIQNSTTGEVLRSYSIDELKQQANLMRGYNLAALCAAGSGHAGGTLSIMDITAALYLRVANHDPKNPNWPDRDRIVWSTGHKAPSLYLGLAFAGFCPKEDVALLRKLSSPYQGHPHWLKLPGVEVSTGSLGQGLSIAVGIALAARLDKKNHHVFCIMGDGEQQEGQIWEAAMEAGHFKLDNLIGIIDRNRLQIDGWVKDVMNVEPLEDKYRSFGWDVVTIDGHDMKQVVEALEKAKAKSGSGKPTVIIANTVKGKGVSFMEDEAGWHGKTPTREELDKALKELGIEGQIPVEEFFAHAKQYQSEVERKLEAKMPKFHRNYWWNAAENMKVQMKPTRLGFGQSLAANGDDPRIVCLGLDISGSITISEFYAGKPERKARWISMGIAEQSATSAAAGLAKEGKLPVFGTYATFAAARNLDQIRTSICYGNFNVLIAGAHGGVSVGPDGATHQALEDLFRHVRTAQHERGRPLRHGRNPQSHRLPAAEARRPEVHPLRARSDADRHRRENAVRLRQGQRDSPASRSGEFHRCVRDQTRIRIPRRVRRPDHRRLRPHGARSHACRLDPEVRLRLRNPHPQSAHAEAARHRSDRASRARHGRRRDR